MARNQRETRGGLEHGLPIAGLDVRICAVFEEQLGDFEVTGEDGAHQSGRKDDPGRCTVVPRTGRSTAAPFAPIQATRTVNHTPSTLLTTMTHLPDRTTRSPAPSSSSGRVVPENCCKCEGVFDIVRNRF